MNSIQINETENCHQNYLLDTANKSPNQLFLPISTTVNQKGHLEIGGCNLGELVLKFGTPLYIIDESTLRTSCRLYRDSFIKYYQGDSQVLYASKALSNLAIARIIESEGLGLDVMSGGELHTALKAGVSPKKLYLHGNNKSQQELNMAISNDSTIVVDNWLELKTLANRLSNKEQIRILLRLTPGIECHTHEYIRTGCIDSKFAFNLEEMKKVFAFVKEQSTLLCVGLHAHIGSQTFELEPFQDLAHIMVEQMAKAKTCGLNLTELNLGGGLGIRYTEKDAPPNIEEWVKAVSDSTVSACQKFGLSLPKLLCEPGRSLIGTSGVTAYTIGSYKEIPRVRTYVAVDGGMSDNPRPITYGAEYRTVVANRMNAPLSETVTIAGKHCESGDILFKNAKLPKTELGDILVAMGTGAYNYSMASNCNRVPRSAMVLVRNGQAHLILKRESLDDLIRLDNLPAHLM
jgi:diaminopimelate decarboxylase